MQPNPFPFGSVLANPFLFNANLTPEDGDVGGGGFESARLFFLLPFLLFQGGDMDLSKVGEKILSSVRSARSLGLLPSTPSDRPEVPARAAAAAAVARALAALPPHQRFSLPSSSEELRSIYGSRPQGEVVEEVEKDFYEEDFDPVRHVLEHVPSEENELAFFEKQAALRLAQLDRVAECLSEQVMQHHEVMVKGMNLVRELEKDLRVANVICMNGRRHLTSSMNEVSRDLIVNSHAKKKQALLDMLPILTELCHALEMQASLDHLVEEGNYCKAFQVLSEYLQLLDSFPELSAMQEMSRGVEVWLGRTLQRLDSLLLGVCQEFKEESYLTNVELSLAINPLLRQTSDLEKIQVSHLDGTLGSNSTVSHQEGEGSSLIALHRIKEMIACSSDVMEPFRLGKLDIYNCIALFEILATLLTMMDCSHDIQVVDAYALIGDISGLAEKIQSFFMQEVISETHSALKNTVQEEQEGQHQNSRLTYSDLCLQIPESKFRHCLLRTLAVLFRLMCSYHEIMSFEPQNKDVAYQVRDNFCGSGETQQLYSKAVTSCNPKQNVESSCLPCPEECTATTTSNAPIESRVSTCRYSDNPLNDARDDGGEPSSSESPWYHLRKDATAYVSQTLHRGRKNLWQLTTSRISVLLSSTTVNSTSIHQFLKNYEDLSLFILAGEAFCGVEAVEFRQKLKNVSENYFAAFHLQSISALKMVLEKESWQKLPSDTAQVISFAGLVGDGAPLIGTFNATNSRLSVSDKLVNSGDSIAKRSGFTNWLRSGNPFSVKQAQNHYSLHNGEIFGDNHGDASDSYQGDKVTSPCNDASHVNGNPMVDDENEDLLADFIDEDSQLPSRISKSNLPKNNSSHWKSDDITAQTGASLCLLRSMDKYARLMQKLEIVNVEFFKGICQLFGVFFYFVFETFGQQNSNAGGKFLPDSVNYRLKTTLSRISQDCDQWIKLQLAPNSASSPTSLSTYTDVTPTSPPTYSPATSFGLKERCAAADTLSLVARILHRSRAHLQSMLLQSNPAIVEDFFVHMVSSVPDLTQHIHKTTARILLHINGYVDRIANAKWEVKELGLEHNGYVDLLLGEFKHYKTRLAHGGIHKEVQDLLLECGLDIVAETLIEGLSRVKRCTDEGRALMSLDLQVLINGLQHFVSSINVKPKLQQVETFIKAYYLPETEYVHWARVHPEYSKNQIVGLVNLVATMKGWKRKTRLEVIEKIESAPA